MIPSDVREEILVRLRKAEAEHGVRVLFAIESGSRAWGFASPNSDYDVRFVYAHPAEWYLRVDLEESRDVIEYPIVDDIDLNGWDVRKALQLYRKTNPAFVEWIQSPIQYVVNGDFLSRAQALLPEVYLADRGIHHYRSQAKTNYRGYLRGDEVPLKKYFYALRPLLAVRWIEKFGSPPPIEFQRLLVMLDGQDELLADIDVLLAHKMAAPELGRGEAMPRVNGFIESELSRLEGLLPAKLIGLRSTDALNLLFRQTIGI